jgi:hypothetical protein
MQVETKAETCLKTYEQTEDGQQLWQKHVGALINK